VNAEDDEGAEEHAAEDTDGSADFRGVARCCLKQAKRF
jgi:hypothetical protein